MREWLGQMRSFALGAFVLGAIGACNSAHRGDNGTSETHFLRSCTATCADGYSCLCGVCTLACDDDAVCEGEGNEAATCGAPGEDRNECGGVSRVCDLRCSSRSDCRALGADFTCEAGRCRGPSAPVDAGTPAGRGGAGSSGRSGGAGTGMAGSTAPARDGGAAPVDGGSAICSLPPQSGSCFAAITRYYHDPATGSCRQFTYGGCGGNSNNFATLAACQDECGGATPVCELPPETGTCEALIRRYYHNAATGRCEEFTYGGCDGNANNFETPEACQAACGGGPPSTCALPPEVGPCNAAFPRWYHDAASGECKQFTYGGCQGNANNFETLEACRAACRSPAVEEAACEVNGVVYPSGADGIDDPTSCNMCSCDDGQLICTDIACPEPCPEGTTFGVSCSQCGPVDNCEVVRRDCLPTCETNDDCTDAPRSCVDGVCRNLCG